MVDPHWEAFVQQHAGHPAIGHETLYALPLRLVEAIVKRAKGFFSEADVQFERDLSKTLGAGFFLQKTIRDNFMPETTPKVDDEIERELQVRTLNIQSNIQNQLGSLMKAAGKPDLAIEEYFKEQAETRERSEQRRRGYAGWLVTHPEFYRERAEFCGKWATTISQLEGIPAVPFALMRTQSEPIPEHQRLFYGDYMTLYRRWSLEGLLTKDIPVPLQPELVNQTVYDLPSISEAGLHLYIPWYLLADKDITLRNLTEHRLKFGDLPHLQGWLEGDHKKWGYKRFGMMFYLYIYLELALKQRYEERLRGKLNLMDLAFADTFANDSGNHSEVEKAAETFRKLRLEMQRRLKLCEAALR